MSRRVGLLGGTFDPVHLGHLIVAEDVRVQLGLDQVLFLPARQSPLKQDRQCSPVDDRLAMTELAVASNPYFAVSRVELERGLPSYTVETVQYLLEQLGPGAVLYFMVGLDQAAQLPRWKDPDVLLDLCQLVFMTRPGWQPLDYEMLETYIPRSRERTIVVTVPAIGISSTEIRRRVSQGLSIRYLVPEAVEEYVLGRGLYRESDRQA
ncbi:MAG: nicotinate-nucleotide adenylyltransferase [Dehalococcoidia bacterium]|nr:nicotinate-nucleotide adenylyltransferase [Dehalococcoidia bacterium]